jgi:hypothetical protein
MASLYRIVRGWLYITLPSGGPSRFPLSVYPQRYTSKGASR